MRRAVSLDGETFTDAEVVLKKGVDIRTGKRVKRDALKPKYDATRFDNDLVIPERIAAMCQDLFGQLCANGGPEQKVIVFCTRDLHADRVAMQLNNRYAEWCKAHEQPPKDRYAFKCTEQGGSELIETFRGSGQRCFIACTVDLLATGVDIERPSACPSASSRRLSGMASAEPDPMTPLTLSSQGSTGAQDVGDI